MISVSFESKMYKNLHKNYLNLTNHILSKNKVIFAKMQGDSLEILYNVLFKPQRACSWPMDLSECSPAPCALSGLDVCLTLFCKLLNVPVFTPVPKGVSAPRVTSLFLWSHTARPPEFLAGCVGSQQHRIPHPHRLLVGVHRAVSVARAGLPPLENWYLLGLPAAGPSSPLLDQDVAVRLLNSCCLWGPRPAFHPNPPCLSPTSAVTESDLALARSFGE